MAGRSRTNVPATVYKDFQPRIERKDEQDANMLIIHLPDFPKEQINVSYVDSSRTIKIQAERAMERNTRSRFNQAFPVSENCIVEKIQGSFRNGVLTITMPKRTTTTQLQLDSPKHDNIPKQTTPPNSNTPPKASTSTSAVKKQEDQKIQTPLSPPKTITELKPPMATPPPPQIAELKPPMASSTPPPQITGLKPPMTPPPPPPIAELKPPMTTTPQTTPPPKEKQQTEGKNGEALSPLKQQEETQRKVQTEDNATRPGIVQGKGETKDGLKDLIKQKTKDSKTLEKIGIEEKSKEGGGRGGFLEKAREIKGMDTIMKTVKRLATDDLEDRQLLINIGVSVVVIVALGAYITYTYRKAKN